MDSGMETERLRLRAWRESDFEPFAALNADAAVMRHFPSPLSRAESDVVARRLMGHIAEHGFGFWAVELPDGPEFIGFVGLSHCPSALPFAPAVEIGWRLARAYQGRGYATEAARRCLNFGFEALRLEEIVAYTVPSNTPSRRVMEKLGMTHNREDDFGHPRVPVDHPLHRHVLYRIQKP